MIIWLASYPKSGNTLLRSILAAYFFSNDGKFNLDHLNGITQFPLLNQFLRLGIDISNDKTIFENFIEAQKEINNIEKNKINFLKTHAALAKINDVKFTDLNNTLGALYIVRDPRNVVTSFAHHMGLEINAATETMIDPTRWLLKTEKNAKTFLGSWNLHYNSWKKIGKKGLIIKYEDLVEKKKTTLIKVFKFLETLSLDKNKFDINKLNNAIESTDFKRMQTLEKEQDFIEGIADDKTGKRKTFFKLGPKNNWKDLLDTKNRIKIETAFQKEMQELGYL